MSGDTTLAKLEQQTWLERWLPQLRDELEALSSDELIPLNIDVPSAICTVYGVLPKLRQLRERIADELPRFDLAAFDRLELYADALHKVHAHYLTTIEPPDQLDDVVQQATTLRAQLLADGQSLALRGLINPGSLRNVKTQTGFKALASDLLTLAAIFGSHWPTLAGKCPTPESDITLAQQLGIHLLRTLGRRQFPHSVAAAAQLRLRTFTLLARTYDDARRAVTYLCGRQTDPNKIAPSLYGGRKRRKSGPVSQRPPTATSAGSTSG